MGSQPNDHRHPVVEFSERLAARLDSLAGVPVTSMSAQDMREVMAGLARSRAQLDALQLRLLAEAEHSQATVGSGAATAADWLAVKTRQVRRDARSDLKLATRLEGHDCLAAAMGQGRVNLPQARAVVAALQRLPGTGEFAVTAEQRQEAEAHLVALAADHDAKDLRVLGRRIFEVVAPDLAERFEGAALEAEEALALRRTSFTMREDDDGTTHGRFRIPTAQAQMLDKMILALCSPVRPSAAVLEDHLPTPVRHGHALCRLIEAIPATSLPQTGGCGATVVVTMTLDQLLGELDAAGVCFLDTGGRISAAQARRLACSAGVIPAVLGGRSQVLDLGRKARVFTEHQRVALSLTQGGCTAEGCQAPPGMCHAHHDVPWVQGGATDLATGRLVCPHHHRRIHDPRFQTTRLSDGTIRFHRRE